MNAKEFLDNHDFKIEFDEYGVYIAEKIVIKFMNEYAKHYHQSKVNNSVLGGVINWADAKKRLPNSWGEEYLTCCRNKNKEDGIWLYDVAYYEGEWGKRSNWEDVLYWAELPKKPCL